MRAQFMELTAPRRCLALNSLSANRALTMSYVIIIIIIIWESGRRGSNRTILT